jgi:hypothetical protein
MAPAVQPSALMLPRLSISLGIVMLTAVAGCSGAEKSDLFGPEANGGGAASSQNEPATSSDSTTPSPGSTPSNDPAPSDPAPSDPDKAPNPGPTKPACAAEGLDNDEFKNADEFDACIAGSLIDRDVDYVSTVAPANAKQILIEHTESGGNVAYKVYVNGFSASFYDEPPDDLPAIAGAKYTFKVERPYGATGDRDWQLKVTFQ